MKTKAISQMSKIKGAILIGVAGQVAGYLISNSGTNYSAYDCNRRHLGEASLFGDAAKLVKEAA